MQLRVRTSAITPTCAFNQMRVRGGWSGGGALRPAGNTSLPSGIAEPNVATSPTEIVSVGDEYFTMQVASRHFWQSNGDGAAFGQHGISDAISIDSVAAIACADIAIDENGMDSGERITPTAIKNANSRFIIIWRFIELCSCSPLSTKGRIVFAVNQSLTRRK